MKMIQISNVGFGIDPRSGQQVLFLSTSDKSRVIPIGLNLVEAHAIGMSLSGAKSLRPQTHQLLFNAIAIDHNLESVQIDLAPDNLLIAFIKLSPIVGKGTNKTLIATTADAICLALKAKADIFVSEHLMMTIGVPTNAGEDEQDRKAFKQFVESINASDFNNKGPERFNSPEVA